MTEPDGVTLAVLVTVGVGEGELDFVTVPETVGVIEDVGV